MAQELEQIYEVVINDPEHEIQYSLNLNYDDYIRSQTDEAFANSLLFHARCNRKTVSQNIGVTQNLENNENNSIVESQPHQQEENETEETCNSKVITIWTFNQTRDMIQSMGNHIDDLNHPRKRKHVFDLIANDLVSNGYNVNGTMVQNKWRSLTRSYNKAKDSRKTTGVGPSRFQFFDILDEILGDKPTNNCGHSLNSIENIEPILSEVENMPCTSSDIMEEANINENNNNIGLQQKKRNRSSTKILDKEYIQMKKEEYKNRQKRHDDKVQLQKEKLALDNKKLELLEKLLLKK